MLLNARATCIVERSAKEIDERLMWVVFSEALKLTIIRVIDKLMGQGVGNVPADFLVMLDGDIVVPAGIPCAVRTVIDGDKRVWQIGAASLIAKVQRDAKMQALHEKYPDYQFDKNKGYPVPKHKALLKKLGPSPVHRKTFKPVAEWNGLPEGFEE